MNGLLCRFPAMFEYTTGKSWWEGRHYTEPCPSCGVNEQDHNGMPFYTPPPLISNRAIGDASRQETPGID